MEVLLITKVKGPENRTLNNRGRVVFIHEMFWFMPMPPWIMGGHIWWSCRHSHEDWCEEPGNDSKNNSLTWTQRRQFTWIPCYERKPVQEVFMILLTFQLIIVWQIVWQSRRQKQTIWSQQRKQRYYWKLTFIQTPRPSWNTRPSCPHGAEHSCTQGRKMLCSWTPKRIVSHQLHEQDHPMWCLRELPWILRVKMLRKITSAFADSRVSSFMKTMTLYMYCRYNHFSECLTFLLSQCCDNVDIKVHWCLQNLSVDEKFLEDCYYESLAYWSRNIHAQQQSDSPRSLKVLFAFRSQYLNHCWSVLLLASTFATISKTSFFPCLIHASSTIHRSRSQCSSICSCLIHHCFSSRERSLHFSNHSL